MILNKNSASTLADSSSLIAELVWQLRNAKTLVSELGTQPAVYRTLTAVRSRARCLQVCRSIGLSLEGLKSLWDQLDEFGESELQTLDQLNQLASAFQHAEFPLQRIDVQFFHDTEHITSKIYDGDVTLNDGLQQLKESIEATVDGMKIKENWKSLAMRLYREIDRSRCRDDHQEEHSMRMILWSLNGGVISPPPEYVCPLSLTLMQDPVILCESEICYEKKEILSWLAKEEIKRCPVSLKKLKTVNLVDNKPLKAVIQDWIRTQSIAPMQKSESVRQSSSNGLLLEDMGIPNLLLTDSLSGHGSEFSSRSSGSLTAQIQFHEIITAMLKAAENGNLEILKEAIAQGLTLNEENDNGETCMKIACTHGQNEVVEFLLQYGCCPNDTSKVGSVSPLILAASHGHEYCVASLLAAGADLTYQDERGWTPLHAACDNGKLHTVKVLVRYGIEFDMDFLELRTETGWTALHNSARSGDVEILDTLVMVSCDINAQCNAGWTPLHVAVEMGHSDMVTHILKQPTLQLNIKSKQGWTALHVAVDQDNVEIGKLLIQAKIDVDATSEDGITPLHRAAYANKLEFGKLIVEKGKADLNVKTKMGRKAIQIAGEKGNYDFYNYLHWKSLQYLFRKKKSSK
eukprot:g5314.t1